eukprot:CAMPEP_0204909490 /NCGR_PEP_ID=MMETSP1397-20131031/8202_1 /ASSEMBLY_ACC=CAM_ASM_000891 /TAXON_ID=49980 /ORGANISM="Climacostomum Climacostomum virens, Strain Stock W-24" /LENGTH=513 /DNA_ID=CAMNT_0052079347 /DNA_START=44 /DNA_END=1585 /DNA_ORIENTATION=+
MGCCGSYAKTFIEESQESERPQSQRALKAERKQVKAITVKEITDVSHPTAPAKPVLPTPAVSLKAQLILQLKSPLSSYYRVDKLLGEGATGFVYRATNRTTGVVRAVKTINTRKVSAQVLTSIKGELEVMRTIDHPHIAKVYEIIEEENKLHVVTEFCAGGELINYLTAIGTCSENRAACWFMQLMSAVTYLHRLRIRLKDLKPENVLLDTAGQSGSVKIINFGTGLVLQRIQSKDIKNYHLSPEVEEGSFSDKSDIWSCGVILCLILTGQPPTKKASGDSYTTRHPDFTGQEWSGVSSEAKDLLGQMLMFEPSSRPNAVAVLDHQWVASRVSGNTPDLPLATRKLRNLSDFKASSALYKATLAYISTTLCTETEAEELGRLFISLDKDKDGQLTATEVMEALGKTNSDLPVDIDTIFSKIDADGNGFISYSEFLMATIDWPKALTESRLEYAFKAFDKDNDGFISVSEVKSIFSEDDPMCQAIVAEVDLNIDGRVDFQEFKAMMKRKRNSLV